MPRWGVPGGAHTGAPPAAGALGPGTHPVQGTFETQPHDVIRVVASEAYGREATRPPRAPLARAIDLALVGDALLPYVRVKR